VEHYVNTFNGSKARLWILEVPNKDLDVWVLPVLSEVLGSAAAKVVYDPDPLALGYEPVDEVAPYEPRSAGY